MTTQVLPTTVQPSVAAGPITADERLQIVDILRGFALFGILLVNMAFFKSSWFVGVVNEAAGTNILDTAASVLIALLAEAKFFTLFSFLFGFGFAIQMLRAQQKGIGFVPRFMRRLLVLLLIGLVHAFLIWSGDILVSYALIGFVLILFRNRSPKALLIWALVLLLVQVVLAGIAVGLIELARGVPEAAAQFAEVETQIAAQFQQAYGQDQQVYGSGSYGQIVAYRASQSLINATGGIASSPTILAMFLLGLYAGKRGILHDPANHARLLRRIRLWGLSLGLLLSALVVAAQMQLGLLSALYMQFINSALAGPVLSMGYAATIVLLAQHEPWRRRLTLLAAPGRMALTNYLLQSLICTTIFYSYGLGFFGQLGAAGGLLLALVIYSLQIPLSLWWLRRYRFGPMEWLWRSLTYLRPQPLRLQSHKAPAR